MTEQLPPQEVTVGLRFRLLIGDERALWEVKEQISLRYWECEVVNEPYVIGGETYDSDFAGTREAYAGEKILGALRIDSLFGGYDPANYEPQTREIGPA